MNKFIELETTNGTTVIVNIDTISFVIPKIELIGEGYSVYSNGGNYTHITKESYEKLKTILLETKEYDKR